MATATNDVNISVQENKSVQPEDETEFDTFVKPGTDQDAMQKVFAALGLVLEGYKMVVASMLVIFSSIYCQSYEYFSTGVTISGYSYETVTDACTQSENLEFFWGTAGIPGLAFTLNIITTLVFSGLYYIEYRRELKLIAYLEKNPHKSNDDKAVANELLYLSQDRLDTIEHYETWYKRFGIVVLILYPINVIVSFIIVNQWHYDSSAYLQFFTSVALILSKINAVFVNIRAPPHTFYSGFIKSKIQYNDVDPDKRLATPREQ